MEIGRHVILGYDLKLPPSDGDSSTAQDRTRWERSFGRLTERQREAWHTAYAASNRAFRETKLTGQDLVRWKYQRYIVQNVENRKARVGSAERVAERHDKTAVGRGEVGSPISSRRCAR